MRAHAEWMKARSTWWDELEEELAPVVPLAAWDVAGRIVDVNDLPALIAVLERHVQRSADVQALREKAVSDE